MAAFNLDEEEREVKGSVSPTDVGFADGRYAYYEHFTGEGGILECGERIPVTLHDVDTYRLYTFLPYNGTPVCFGNADMFIGVGAITKMTDTSVTLYEGGRIAFLSESDLGIIDLPTEKRGLVTYVHAPRETKEILYREI